MLELKPKMLTEYVISLSLCLNNLAPSEAHFIRQMFEFCFSRGGEAGVSANWMSSNEVIFLRGNKNANREEKDPAGYRPPELTDYMTTTK